MSPVRAPLLSIVLILCAGQSAHSQEFRSAILDSAAGLAPTELEVERERFLRWLDANLGALRPDQVVQAREYVYFLIGSAAQAHYRATRQVFPVRDTLGLAELFERGSRLGLYGAGLVARALDGDSIRLRTPPVLPSGTLRLEFNAPHFTIRSTRNGWTLRFPYLFMISGAETQVPRNGVETEAVMLSTLFGRHRGSPGHSQATVLLVAAQVADPAAFFGFWLGLLGVGSAHKVATPLIPGGTTYRTTAASPPLEKEVVTLSRGRTAILIGYFGMPGTFEANRAHFVDLLGTLTVSASAP